MSVQTRPGPQPYALPRLRSDVVLGPALRAGDTVVHHVKDRRTGWFYKVGPREHFIMSRLDGEHALDTIAAQYAAEFDRALGPENWGQVFTMLGKRQLIDGAVDDAAVARLSAAQAAGAKAALGWRKRRFVAVSPDAWIGPLVSALRWAFSWWFLVPALLAVAGLEVFVLSHLPELFGDVRGSGRMWLVVPLELLGGWILIVLHELGHGVACKRYGGTVAEIGVMWRFPAMVAPYCKTDDVLLFATRRARLATAFAGMFVSLLALLPLWAWWALSTEHGVSRAVAAALLLFGGVTALLNLVPFLQLDGYHMLGHTLGVADLRVETTRFWGRLLKRAHRGYRRIDMLTYVLYGVASIAFYVGGYVTLCVLWYHQLARWTNPTVAVVLLVAETIVLVGLFGLARRPKR